MSTSASLAVSMMIGTPDSARMIRQTSTPDSSGSIRSRRTRSGRSARNSASACAAVGRGDGTVALEIERFDQRLAKRRLVVHDEDRACHARRIVAGPAVNAVFIAGSTWPPVLTLRSSAGRPIGAIRRPPARRAARSRRRCGRASGRGPSATSVSNSGGVAVRPVVATRIAMNRSPAFQPRASTSSRSGGSSSSASQVTVSCAASRSRAAASASAVVAASQRLGTTQGRVHVQLVDPQEADRSVIAARVGSRSRTIGRMRAQLVLGGGPVDRAVRRRGLEVRQQPLDQVVVVEPADPLAVEPLEALAVEPGATLLDLARSRTAARARRALNTSSSVPGDQPRKAK